MGCFIVPATEAVATTIIKKVVKSKEINKQKENGTDCIDSNKISFSRKLGWLNKLLIGGSVLLAFEHVWHGEVTPWFPFLTAATDRADAHQMLHEMATAGVSMAVVVTVAWAVMLVASSVIEKKTLRESREA